MVELAFRLRNGGLTMRTCKVTFTGRGGLRRVLPHLAGLVFGVWYLVRVLGT